MIVLSSHERGTSSLLGEPISRRRRGGGAVCYSDTAIKLKCSRFPWLFRSEPPFKQCTTPRVVCYTQMMFCGMIATCQSTTISTRAQMGKLRASTSRYQNGISPSHLCPAILKSDTRSPGNRARVLRRGLPPRTHSALRRTPSLYRRGCPWPRVLAWRDTFQDKLRQGVKTRGEIHPYRLSLIGGRGCDEWSTPTGW